MSSAAGRIEGLFADLEYFFAQSGPHLHIPPLFPGCLPMDVRVDFSASTSSGGREHAERNGNDGMRDIGPPGNGNRVLLVRGLDPQTSQEEVRDRLSAEIVRLAATMPGDGRGSVTDGRQAIRRVVIIRYKNTKISTGLAFVELVSTDIAVALLAHLLSRVAQPVGVVVNGRPVACSFANSESFVLANHPESGNLPVQTTWLIRGETDGGIGNVEGWVKYREDYQGASEVRTPPPGASMAIDPNLELFLASLVIPTDDVVSRTKGKKESGEAAGPKLLDRSAGGFKMQPVKLSFGAANKKKEKDDVMVALPVAGNPVSRADVPMNGMDRNGQPQSS